MVLLWFLKCFLIILCQLRNLHRDLSLWISRNNPKPILTHAKEVHLRWRSWAKGLWRGSCSWGQTTGRMVQRNNAASKTPSLSTNLISTPLHLWSSCLFSERQTQEQTPQTIIVAIISKQQFSEGKNYFRELVWKPVCVLCCEADTFS